VVVHCVGCVCNQSWHVCTCLSNSWHKLQAAVFAQLAVADRRSNTNIYVIAIFTMCESTECTCIKFCFKIGKTATETYHLLLQAYGEDAMVHTQVFDLFHPFKEGRTSIESDPHSGRPFFDSKGIIQEYAPNGQTIKKEFYVEVLWSLHESVCWKWLEKWWDGDWILHHDNVPTHTSHLVQQFLVKHSTAQLHQSPYSPDLTSCDFSYSQGLRKFWKDTDVRQWRTSNEIWQRHY